MLLRGYSQPDIKDKKVLLRLDLDVDVNDQGEVDQYHDLRLRRAVGTIAELLTFGAKQIIIFGHRGRPAGKFDPTFRLTPVRDYLELLLNKAGVQEPISLVNIDSADKKGNDVLVMLENLRFYPGEKTNDPDFTRQLSVWGEVYINDAFGNSHRSHASMLAITKILPSFAGPSLINEVKELSRFLANTPRPFIAVLGGAKIETKIPLIQRLIGVADTVLVGGALANTILKSRGLEVGQSLVEDAYLADAKKIDSPKIILPIDATLSDGSVAAINSLNSAGFIGDIGPKTVALFQQKIAAARAILWNGPMGKYEDKKYQRGTNSILAVIISSAALKVVGGGDTLDILNRSQAADRFDFVSVGGGAMLTFLAGEPMPALDALKQ